MTEDLILLEVQKIFSHFFKKEDLILTPSTSANDIPEWDSLNHMSLMGEVENHFQIQFEFFELMELENVGDLIQTILSKKAG